MRILHELTCILSRKYQSIIPESAKNCVKELFVPEDKVEQTTAEAETLPNLDLTKVASCVLAGRLHRIAPPRCKLHLLTASSTSNFATLLCLSVCFLFMPCYNCVVMLLLALKSASLVKLFTNHGVLIALADKLVP